ncbi:WD repeat-containing protein 89-like isoform X1 [Lingula anatina]|uniref:WD repeat-containing protein 89 n=1 Tax=Lingula anatina TaxID=7574 RepID=A0A1S3HZD0_LINAN|nr:WD repeat-containing protein 89-like isoform X1 [Lingula anatina]XP_013391369.1 WD repeat-containing protein 89-like isoform X1 [Lingula anatina]XP_013391401.1 WD repeat-containing protein 89-like isoform X1 [Lingula anatina]XP_023932014.1 WD repeat-containing protein 89-like isoform X1 [Lingula anatina]XP_023932015.1 WD repeat-containing protein 89-like isoform X1 [Lingula anatina]XP_023932016.1 WD repeat-containing protein 89-like isoform X1 [Lingula anatina]XP_023932017.1 WD repeat-cont|eukprot:XP_013391356.1 WD repeat-containing protein 89-like isoform X1 [Lingula anatina]
MAELENMSQKLSQLHLVEKSAIYMEVPQPDYVLLLDSQACSRCNKDPVLAATSSNHTVRLFNRNTLASIGTVEGHQKAVTGVKFGKTNTDLLYTSSLDGTVRCWDIRSNLKQPVQSFTVPESLPKAKLCCLDISCDDGILCAGTEQFKAKKKEKKKNKKTCDEESDMDSDEEDATVYMLFWDCRKSKMLGCYKESHQDDITQVCFHPSHPDRLASGSTDGLVCTFHINETCEDDALQCIFNTESTVYKIGWGGKDNNAVYCLTHMETFHIWDTVESESMLELKNPRDLFKGKSQVDYLVDCFHGDQDRDKFHLLTGTHSGSLNIVELYNSQQTVVATLEGGHNATVRCMNWDEETVTLVTGGEDSMTCLWKPGQIKSEHTSSKASERKKKSQVKSKFKASVTSKPYQKKDIPQMKSHSE